MRCRLFHQWSKWEKAIFAYTVEGSPQDFLEEKQKRTCQRCGRKQIRGLS